MKMKNLHNKNEGFKVPDGYFDSFEDHLFDTLEETTSIPKNDGLKIPSDYLENLDDKIFSNYKKTKVFKLNSKRNYYILTGIAASILFVLILRISVSSTKVNFADLQETEIEDYFTQNDISLNAYEVVQVYNDIDLNEIQMTDEEIEDDDLIDYLSDSTNSYGEFIIEE